MGVNLMKGMKFACQLQAAVIHLLKVALVITRMGKVLSSLK